MGVEAALLFGAYPGAEAFFELHGTDRQILRLKVFPFRKDYMADLPIGDQRLRW